jgi:prepilin-type N-terminal cleavage/methylation domain-containing protein
LETTLTRLAHKPLRRADGERGFTIIEVMVAIFILLLGVLGSVTMLDTANGITANNKGREGALNLSREIVEASRKTDYDSLTASGAEAALQGNSGLADADATTAGWQLIRRGVSYTVTASACIYDDAKDGGRSTADLGAYCAGSAGKVDPAVKANCTVKSPTLPCVDTQPDDFRRIAITSQWTINGNARTSTQTTLLVNPSGGRGPRITNVTVSPALVNNTFGPATPGASVTYTVTTNTPAGSVDWTSSDGQNKGQATAGATNTWTFTYPLGTAGTAGSVVDGTYTVSIQAFSGLGAAGDLNAQTLVVNRLAPNDVTGFQGGRDDRAGNIVDFQWIRNTETDIRGYRVYLAKGQPDWTNPSGDPPDVLVCGTVSTPLNAASCYDSSPPSNTPLTYYVKAVDTDINGNLRESSGAATAQFTTGATAASPPIWAGIFTATQPSGVNTLTWTPVATPVKFYRIYRDPSSSNPGYGERYDTSATATYQDQNPGASTAHTYTVTAVDNSFEESAPFTPFVTTP